ncbi:MFS transporter, partial [Paraburkholderia sp. Ac-20347]|nr:MFS transporter [Paraburkholderia sp. Ac-20347]
VTVSLSLAVYSQSVLVEVPVAYGRSPLAYRLPALVCAPIDARVGMRLLLARASAAGLFTVELGFLVMRAGSAFGHGHALAVLPGCLVAGAGLGITNTPVTNTTTGSVSADRAGMASGIDMSARMVTLAINIALMGSLLVASVARHLEDALGDAAQAVSWQALAARVAAGNLTPGDGLIDPAHFEPHFETTARAALEAGFNTLMLYGGLAVCTLAVLSYLIFSRRPSR